MIASMTDQPTPSDNPKVEDSLLPSNQTHILWVDVFKFLGIWAIYIGHFGDKAGRAYPFVFTYHVPMFFFAAGFFAIRYLKDSPMVFIKKKTRQLMVPYIFFSLGALIFFTLQNDWDILQSKSALTAFLSGIRGRIVAGSLWFIPCLYIIVVSDYFIVKLFKSRVAALAVSIGAFLASQTLLPNNPAYEPSWFMNLDSALFYYVYYSLGAVLFPFIGRDRTTTIQRATTVALTAAAFTVAIITFFLTSHWFFGKITLLFPSIGTFKLSIAFFDILIALVIIYCNIVAAKLFAHISFLGKLGRETLVFCGTEDVAKHMLTELLAVINLKVRLNNPFVTIAFALICLVISKYTLVGFLNTFFPWAVGKINPTPSAMNSKVIT